MKQPFTQLLWATLLLTAGVASTQTPFWSEDFANGIPAGWTNADAAGNGVLWEYCTGPFSNCVNLYDQNEFESTTASNGFVALDSDAAGEKDHVSQLTTSAIDCSAAAVVFVTFENYLGVYNTPSSGSVLLKVSADGANWTAYDAVPGVEANQSSANPYIAGFNISEIAAHQPTVYLQWEWTGHFEYWWMLDNVALISQDLTPNSDLVLGEFFYPPASYATPASQMATDTFEFYARVSNKGTADQQNVQLFALVIDENHDVLFADSIGIDVLPAGYPDTLMALPNRFVPALNTGQYTIVYVVRSDSTDARPDDNTDNDLFEVTDHQFAKESGATSASRPLTVGDYAFANLYQMSAASLEQYKAVSLVFSAAVDSSASIPLSNLVVGVYLFKVKEEVRPDFSNFDETTFISPSFEWLSFSSYDYPQGADNFAEQTALLRDLNTGEQGVLLQPGARYFAAIEYTDESNVAFHSVSEETSHYFLSSLVYTETDGWFAGYSPDFNPVIRMNIALFTSTDERPLPETAFRVLANPIQNTLTLQVDLDQAADATITLAELSGRVIRIDNRKGLTNELLTYQVQQLANGTYLARMATKKAAARRNLWCKGKIHGKC